jgi:hypothetical protein
MKRILIIAFSIFSISLVGCLKDKPNVDFSTVGTIVEIEYPAGANNSGLGSGLESFSGGTFTFPPSDSADNVGFMVNVASVKPLNKDLAITIGLNSAAITAYNSANTIQFVQMPDSDYSLTTKTGTIPAGTRLLNFNITIYPDKIDPTQNFMLPISILDASGQTISGNFNTIYFHTIGNPLAGAYNWDFTRWNNTDSTGPNSGTFTGHPTSFLPDDPTTIEVPSGYYIHPRYVLTFTNTGGVLSNFQVSLNPADVAQMALGGVSVNNGPNIIVADGVNKYFEFQFTTPAPRFVIDRFYK